MKQLSAVSLLALALFSCGKDQTVEEYQREENRKNFALYQSVSDFYTGYLVSKVDGSILGAVKLTLEAKNGTGNGPAGGNPYLEGRVDFLDDKLTQMQAPVGYYDPNTGIYSTQINITPGGNGNGDNGAENGNNRLTAAAAPSLQLNGAIGAANFTGQISATGFNDVGATLELTRKGRSLEDLIRDANLKRPPEENNARQVSTFTGDTTFFSVDPSVTKKVRIVILEPVTGGPIDFYNLISPVKTVQASLNYGGRSLQLQFANAFFDARQFLLAGQATYSVGGQQQKMTLDCRRTTGDEIRCSHLTTGSGETAVTKATLDKIRTQDPADPGEDRKLIKRKFKGRAKYDDGKTKKAELNVNMPARTRFDELMELFFPVTERVVNISVIFDSVVSANMTGSRWDILNGVLEGSYSSPNNGGYTQYIQCMDFYFTNQTKKFQCRFWSSRSPEIELSLEPASGE